MKKILLGFLLAYFSLVGWSAWSFNQNPVPGSVWTYLGPSFGADWASTSFHNCTNFIEAGGDASGVNPSDSAFTVALATLPAANPCIYIPPGTYKFTSTNTYNLSGANASVSIYGDGAGVTKLLHTNAGDGWTFVRNSINQTVHFRGFSFITNQAGAGNGITLTQSVDWANPAIIPQSDFSGVSFYGDDYGAAPTHYWSRAIYTMAVSQINFAGVYIQGGTSFVGDGVYLSGRSAAIGVQFNFVGCTFDNLANGIVYGTDVQGVQVAASNFTGVVRGITAPAGGENPDQLAVVGSQFNATTAGIDIELPFAGLIVSGNLFIVEPGAFGVTASNLFNANQIVGNSFQEVTGGSGTGVRVQATGINSGKTLISGNSYGILGIGNALFFTGNFRVTGNAYDTALSVQNSPSPVVSSGAGDCGTSPALQANSWDENGTVTVGTSTNGGICTVQLIQKYAQTPSCLVQNQTTANALRPVMTNASGLVTLKMTGTLTAGDKLTWVCMGN